MALIDKQAVIDALRTCYDTEAITYTNGNEYIDYDQALDLINTLPSVQQEDGWLERNKDRILRAGLEGREIEFRIGGRLFAIREKAQ